MRERPMHSCSCPECQKPGANPTKDHHTQLNLFLGTLSEHQRRLFTGLEANRLGAGAEQQLAQVTGLCVADVTLGQRSLIRAQTTGHIPDPGAYPKKKTLAAHEGLARGPTKLPPTLPDHLPRRE